MIIDKNSDFLTLKNGYRYTNWYVCKRYIDAEENIIINLAHPVIFKQGISAKGYIQTNVTIKSKCDIISDCEIKAIDCDVIAYGDIISRGSIIARLISADGDVKARRYIEAKHGVKAGGNIIAVRGITKGGEKSVKKNN